MTQYFKNGKPLFRNGKPVMTAACCCVAACSKACVWVAVGRSGTGVDSEPGVSPPTSGPFTIGEARIVYHGHALDTFGPIPGFFYHRHLWIMEWCWSSTSNTDAGRNIRDFLALLVSWGQNELSLAWGNDVSNTFNSESGEVSCDDEVAIQMLIDTLLVTPTPTYIVEDLLPLIARDGCPECVGI